MLRGKGFSYPNGLSAGCCGNCNFELPNFLWITSWLCGVSGRAGFSTVVAWARVQASGKNWGPLQAMVHKEGPGFHSGSLSPSGLGGAWSPAGAAGVWAAPCTDQPGTQEEAHCFLNGLPQCLCGVFDGTRKSALPHAQPGISKDGIPEVVWAGEAGGFIFLFVSVIKMGTHLSPGNSWLNGALNKVPIPAWTLTSDSVLPSVPLPPGKQSLCGGEARIKQ